MNINYKDKEIELKFTYNSFRYMEDLDINRLEQMDSNIFSMIGVSRDLLIGAINKEPSEKYTYADVDAILEPLTDSGEIVDFFREIFELLSNSGFLSRLRAIGEQVEEKPKKKAK